jgi:hypothetical protein
LALCFARIQARINPFQKSLKIGIPLSKLLLTLGAIVVKSYLPCLIVGNKVKKTTPI